LITVTYVKGNRGTITVATPTSFVSTGWNLYNHAAGYARVVNYSDEYGFMIDGTYTALEFSETLSGTRTTITPVDGFFTINADGFVWVTGGNETDTAIWMTWSDWTDEPNGGVFEAYTSSTVDLSGVMVDFPDGLMRIGNNYDEINLNTGRAYSRIQKMEYTTENLEAVIASGVEYDTDENYIYAVRQFPATYTISLDGEYTVSDHGLEMYVGTTLPVTSSSLYGQDLKGKLRRDVVTISQQTLTSAQQAQILTNIGAGSAAAVNQNSTAIAKVEYTTDMGEIGSISALESALLSVANNMVIGEIKPVKFMSTASYNGFTAWRRYAGTIYVTQITTTTVVLTAVLSSQDGDAVSIGYADGDWNINKLATKSYVDQWTDISSQFTYSSTYVGTLVAKTDGNWVQLYINVKKGTPDQTTVATIPNAYKPNMTTAFGIFYMHGEDMGRNCTGCIDAASASVQFRCGTTPTGTYGVRLSCVYHI
jgi:hypothetical protein